MSSTPRAKERFRPIQITCFSYILGVVPLVFARGAAPGSRNSLGTGVFGGMLAATILGVFFTPLFFTVVMRLTSRSPKKAGATTVVTEAAPEPAGGVD